MQSGRIKPLRLMAIMICAFFLFIGIVFSLSTGGRSDFGLSDLWSPSGDAVSILYDIRWPRTLVALLLGINLGLAGLALQAITRNPLASPAILGINQGAALGITLALIWPMYFSFPIEVMAIMGAAFAGLTTFAISGGFSGRIDTIKLVLGGIAVGALAYAIVRFSFTLEDELARSVVRWTVGDIADTRWPSVWLLGSFALSGLVLALLLAHRFNLMALGEGSAGGLGTDPHVTLLLGAALAAFLTGVSVAVAGPIAFAGLVVPHMAKLFFGTDHKSLVPITALLGAALLVAADGFSKVIMAPIEIPIGIVVALIGAPWFLWQTLMAKDLP